ncbi:MAG: MBL fold metallo-hydrolase, partial [Solirubrobacterales bacterium]
DHVGVAEAVRAAGATVHVHEADADMARTGNVGKRERSMLPYLRHRAAWKLLGAAARAGGVRYPKIAEVTTFAGDRVLDVPGRPRAVHTPGHSDGHVALHLPDRGALIAGDALCTWNPLTGRRAPQVMPSAFNVSTDTAFESLDAIESVEAETILTGHGEPWRDGARKAVAEAREART